MDAAVANFRLENVRVAGELEEARSERDKLSDEMAAMRAQFQKESAELSRQLSKRRDVASKLEDELAEQSGKMAELS